MSETGALLDWLKQRGVEFREPALLWALLLLPALLVVYAVARRQRLRMAGAFSVRGRRAGRRPARLRRTLALALLAIGLASLVVGFARPVVPLETPNDRATVVFVLDASTAMRATDVRPTRFEAARALAKTAIGAVPDRLQVAVVGYSRSAYILVPPTHDHGAAAAALARLRTAEDAAGGDAVAAALAAIPLLDEPEGGAPAAPRPDGSPAPKVPAAIVLFGSGELTAGRPWAEASAAAREAGVPLFSVPVTPRQGAEVKAPFDEAALRQLAQASGGRTLSTPSASDWRRIFRDIGSAVTIQNRPQEVGHIVGAAALGVLGVSMLVSLWATRRLL